ncbi:imidazolonepropionase [Carnobacteriaceae bacterium zg-ZUI252]|nr:imidazolonepropionase [Carnobacteriaceae bacterium zg-ZUI252]MBS4770724.1 imidazolonepropionase [Carnobacteriaceae bacterium zg-ZUI240]
MKADKIFMNIGQLFCPNDLSRALKGSEMNEVVILKDAFLAVKDGLILAKGEGDYSEYVSESTELIDCEQKLVTPGLIDSHTHLVYGGSREHEFSQKLNGVSYLDILKAGGGILSSVRATRESSFETLYDKSERLLDYMLSHGVTAVEAKSGYGLNWETEKKQLEVVKALNENHPIELVSTFMAAHAVPQEYKENPKVFLDQIINDMLPLVKQDNLAEFCDIFCEQNVFTAEESEYLLSHAKDMGFKLRIHADEIKTIGGVDVAAKLQTTSAEHLMKITDDGIAQLAKSGVIGNLLPATTFSLMEDTYAPARKMLNHDMAITLSTDSNPGSCPTANIQFIMQLGCFQMKLTPIEVFNAVTINAAYAIDRADKIGSFDVGKQADVVVFDAPNIDYPIYFFATNLVQTVYKNGERVFQK